MILFCRTLDGVSKVNKVLSAQTYILLLRFYAN